MTPRATWPTDMSAMQNEKEDYRALPLEQMEAIVRDFETRVNQAQAARPDSKEFVRQAIRRRGAARCPIRNRALSLDIILKYGRDLAELFSRYPDDVVCLYPYDYAVGYQPPANTILYMTHNPKPLPVWIVRFMFPISIISGSWEIGLLQRSLKTARSLWPHFPSAPLRISVKWVLSATPPACSHPLKCSMRPYRERWKFLNF